MNARRMTGSMLVLAALLAGSPVSAASAADGAGSAAAAVGAPETKPTPITAGQKGTLTDPRSKSGRSSAGEEPALPPRVPPHGRQPHEVGEDEGAAGSASINSYLPYRGGWAQTSPKIYVLFWGDWSAAGDPKGEHNYLLNFYAGVGGSAWNFTNTQYGYNCGVGALGCATGVQIQNPTGQLKGWAYDNSSVPAIPSIAQMEAEAQKAANYWGDRSVNAQYVIAMPSGHRDRKSVDNGWCAWHHYTWSQSKPISYTSFPYIPDKGATCGANKVNAGATGALDGVSILAGHEYVEAMTDPFFDAWIEADNFENADKCLQWQYPGYFRNTNFTTGTFAVEPNWSNYAYQTTGTGCVFWS